MLAMPIFTLARDWVDGRDLVKYQARMVKPGGGLLSDPGAVFTGSPGMTVARIRQQVGSDRVICGLSGGVDSSVAAVLVDPGSEGDDVFAATNANLANARRLATLERLFQRRAEGHPRRIVLKFLASPISLDGVERIDFHAAKISNAVHLAALRLLSFLHRPME